MILLFGPYSPPITGQSLAFKTIVDSQECQVILIDTTKFRSRILNSIWSALAASYFLIFNRRIQTVYFTCTRSVFGSFKDVVLLFMSRWTGTRVINHLHGSDFGSFYRDYPAVLKPVLKKAYNTVETSIILTPGMEEQFSEFPEMKIEIVPNFYPTDFDKKMVKPRDGITILYFSHLMYSKGIFDFLEAIKLISSNYPEIFFKIAGDYTSDPTMTANQVRKEIENFLREHSDLNIKFRGSILTEKRFELLNESDILVLPTFYKSEAVPLVILEAMRCGNAIVTTDHNYLSEIIDERNGCLVESRNPHQLAYSIMNLLSDHDRLLEIQNHNIKEAIDKYKQEKFVRRVNDVITG